MTAPAWDDDYITECLDRNEEAKPPKLVRDPLGGCRWCSHHQHGLRCGNCYCESSYTSRDDSWRPLDYDYSTDAMRRRWFMHDTGVDGWVAARLCSPPMANAAYVRNQRLKWALLNPRPTQGVTE